MAKGTFLGGQDSISRHQVPININFRFPRGGGGGGNALPLPPPERNPGGCKAGLA